MPKRSAILFENEKKNSLLMSDMMDFPTLNTPALVLEPLSLTHLDGTHKLLSTPAVDEYNTLGIPENIAATELIVKDLIHKNNTHPREKYCWTISDKKGEFIGLFGLHLSAAKYNSGEVWYKLHPDFWGKGHATAALNAVLKYSFEILNRHRVEAGCAVANKGSVRVLEKANFTLEGTKRKVLPLKTGWSDAHEFSILQEEWTSTEV